MEKQLLVTVSEEGCALKGIHFIHDFFEHQGALGLTLFYTAPKPRAVWVEEEFFEAMDEYDRTIRQGKQVGRESLSAARKLLAEYEFPEGQVNTKLHLREVSTAKDILSEGERGGYDAIVLGQRGARRFQEMMDESVTEQVVERQLGAPLWICREPEQGRRNVLLCLDGSDAAFRVAEHVGCILANEPRHNVCLMHVAESGLFAADSTPSIYARARKALQENGVDEARISEVPAVSGAVSAAIIAEARSGNYAVVATGSMERKRSRLRRAIFGSVVRDLMKLLTGAVLWVSA
ncbi:universal stress protein [Desulfovibrio ferrophilus]|uniref:UspA domain protein n=1 Tax=Desulfovibrio ferrophilus TaxID=241368 RepID=A0A2Z6B3E6_9BACT|nr:universal stress protein [Desulfovibrio ferrophilus]BBD10011.1 UspA domain protein [Desulfovibrio ferrophilus]